MLPSPSPKREPAGGIAQLRSGLGDARKPDGEQIAVRALGEAGAVIVLRKQRADFSLRNLAIHPRSFHERHIRSLRHDFRRLLADVLRIQRRRGRRQQFSFRQIAEHDAETDPTEASESGIQPPRFAERTMRVSME